MRITTLFKVLFPVLALALLLALSPAATAYTSSADGQVRVWVVFQPGAKGHVQAALNAQNAQFHYTFDDLNAFVVSLPQAALKGLERNPNVALIEEDVQRQLYSQDVPFGIDMVQARAVWDANFDGEIDAGAPTGAGQTVCIIDSGLYTGHEDLQTLHVVGGYPAGWNTDKCGHGTHVAGTIAAANNALGVVGVTPGKASLYIVKVFGDDCGWTYSSTLADASNRCAAAGANIISMSLGGTKKSATEERAFNTHYSKGILSIAAAGNDGNSAISYPGGYGSVVAVAAVDEAGVVADFSQFNSSVELAAPGVAVKSTVPFINNNTLTVDGVIYQANHIDFAAHGTASGALVDGGLCDSSGAWAGSVVLCQRGAISFYNKVMNVQNGGAAAAVIYNNEPGNFLGTLGDGFSSLIPAISLSQEDGQYLVANKLGASGLVESSITIPASGYEYWDGTSMATPHVSGVAALVWSAKPSLTNVQIREALTKTAVDLGASGRDVYYGYGLVQAYDAIQFLGGSVPPPPPPPPPTTTLVVTVTTDKNTYAPRQTVSITATVKDDKSALVSGATASMELLLPNGKVVTGTAVTDTVGVAKFSYRIGPKDPLGDYKITVNAAKDGYNPGTGTATFIVAK